MRQNAAGKPGEGAMKAGPDRWRHDNIGRLLNNAIARFEGRVLQLMTQAGLPDAKLSHISLTRNLDAKGTRVSELARRAGMTKQAMGELVMQCLDLNLVSVAVDNSDKRARIVRFTPQGRQWLRAFAKAVNKAEKEMRQEIGGDDLAVVKKALAAYGAGFDALSDSA